MRTLPRSAQVYIAIVFGLSVFAAIASILALPHDPWTIPQTIALTLLIAILDLLPVIFHGHHVDVLPSTAIKLASVLLVPPPVTLLAVFCGTALSEWRFKRVWYKLVFNVGALTLTYAFVSLTYHLAYEPGVGLLASLQNVAAVMLMGVGDVAVNSLIVALVVALSERQRVVYVWAQTFKPLLLHDLSMLPIGVFIAMLWNATPFSVVLAIAPLLLARRAYQVVVDLETQTRQALFALARVLDERDEATSHHCELVAQYAEMIARELGLGPDEVDIINRAAWLHDIGKVGMPNDILFKPGGLTRAEREEAERHAVIGSDLLTKFPLFEKGAIYVRHHHERWDGAGYPDRLQGDEIPLGARILAVADSYQAMTAERPYRKPMSEEAALEQLRRGAGSQFDPRVVKAFFRARGVAFHSEDLELPPTVSEAVSSLAE
jgi:putative nucleotidyltransferase with HDIG domain